MKTAVEGDTAGTQTADAGNKLDALRDLIPSTVVLVRGGGARSGDGLVSQDKRVQSDDFGMRVKDIDGKLSRYEAGDWRNDRVGLFFAEHLDGSCLI
jgi:hypothetical protein